MKTLSRYLTLILVVAMFLTACGGNSTAPETTLPKQTIPTQTTPAATNPPAVQPSVSAGSSDYCKLTQIATVPDQSGLQFTSKFPYLKNNADENNPYIFLNHAGEDKLGSAYNGYGKSYGNYTILTQHGPDCDLVGLADVSTGEVLVECEAVRLYELSDRYLEFIYVTDLVSEEEDSFHFYMNHNGEIVDFLGYGKVFDLEAKAFVPNLKITTYPTSTAAIGQYIAVEGEYPLTHFYLPNGSLEMSLEYCTVFSDAPVALQDSDEGIVIYNHDLEITAIMEGSFYNFDSVEGREEYLRFDEDSDGDGYVESKLIDLSGNVIFDGSAYDYWSLDGNYVIASNDDSLWGVLTLDGQELIPLQYHEVFYYPEYGLFVAEHEDDSISVVFENGTIYHPDSLMGTTVSEEDGCYFYSYDNGSDTYLILATGETVSFEDSDNYNLAKGFLQVENESGDTSLIEVITGTTLLEGYLQYLYIGDHIYAYKDDVWTVFEVDYNV